MICTTHKVRMGYIPSFEAFVCPRCFEDQSKVVVPLDQTTLEELSLAREFEIDGDERVAIVKV